MGKRVCVVQQGIMRKQCKSRRNSKCFFEQGDATKLGFEDETFDVVTSNYVYHNIPSRGTFAIHDIMSKSKYGDMQSLARKLKDMGYEDVRLIDTTSGMFMSKFEATWMGLSGSTILMGRK